MYQVFADEHILFDSRYEGYIIGKGQINLEANKSGSFVFSLYKDHPYYDRIQKLKTIITVYRDGFLIFRGRVIKSDDGFYNEKTLTCEGELSFLLDSVQRSYSYTGTPAGLFSQFVREHNRQADEDRQFTIGQITVEDPNDYINRSNSNYEDTLTNLNNKLLGTLGGYIYITPGTNGDRVINWLADFPSLSSQSIEFGENLLDFVKTNNAEDIITALIPLGAKIQTEGESVETEARVTIESVNGGKDYIYDAEAVAAYGWIYKSVIWDDVTVPANLLNRAIAYLNEYINLNISIELSAIDLSAMDKNIDAFKIGDYVHVISLPHGINSNYLLTKQSIDLLHPENNKITLGYTFSTFTDRTLANSTTGATLVEKVETIERNYASESILNSEIDAIVNDNNDNDDNGEGEGA